MSVHLNLVFLFAMQPLCIAFLQVFHALKNGSLTCIGNHISLTLSVGPDGAKVTITPNSFQSPLFRAFRILIDDRRHRFVPMVMGHDNDSPRRYDVSIGRLLVGLLVVEA